MPHTTRPKKNQKPSQNKRTTITDDSGWSHVTTTTRARRTYRNTGQEKATETEKEQLKPAEAPSNLTLDDLRQQFNRHYERWTGSESWGVVRGVISSLTSTSTSTSTSADTDTDTDIDSANAGTVTAQIDNITCIGLGSPSGFLRGGWVDRRQVSLVQLAALVSTKELFHNVRVYTQDPVFNTLDKALFGSLGLTVLEHPAGFEKISEQSFLFCPGAEKGHLEEILEKKPRALFGGPLEEMSDSDTVKAFLNEKVGKKVPVFEGDEKAFWGMRVYL
ncbi:SRR1 family protein [Aspergillus glaucus CBS 516.65]|uniref:SRR1-like domain-containing protein n=1 Tax=Aspergillus glaucus CBS 516.65 TaxID=1160497 RepID=A0A1L9VGR8_ASPGL|nr:hypothetical protein ASPGLDRAFT_36500 [Aspergillus glaucus CBS 516.65]OJJ83032.1 hypothetical protein ASPGLDRAFT_36500 [Aspergillus glaucus CBS 516.65]